MSFTDTKIRSIEQMIIDQAMMLQSLGCSQN